MQAYKNKNVKITRRFWLLQSQATTTVVGFSVIGWDYECVLLQRSLALAVFKKQSQQPNEVFNTGNRP